MSKWLYLYFIFIGSGLLYPILYIASIETSFEEETLLWLPNAIAYTAIFGFFIYPFYRGVTWFKQGKKSSGIILIIFGILAPVISGMTAIIIFEFISKLTRQDKSDSFPKNNKNVKSIESGNQ